MRASRALRVFLPFAIVVVLVALAVSVLTARPDIGDAKHAVDQAWPALEQQLNDRYDQLHTVDTALTDAPGQLGDLASSVDTAYKDWSKARSVSARVQAANRLETLGRRLVVAALASARVQRNKDTTALVAAYASAPVPDAQQFNANVAKYERERRGPVRGVVARLMSDGHIPAYVVITAPPA
jgi:hypothetical protein